MPAQTAPNLQRQKPQPRRRPGGLWLNVLFFAILFVLIVTMIALTQPGLREALGIPIAQEVGGTVSAAYNTGIRVTELMSSNNSALPDDQGLFSDWIEVTNLGESPESLLDFGLSDDPGRVRFVFPDITLQPGEALLVFASGLEQGQAGAALHAPFRLSSAGEAVCLFNAQGDLIEQIDLPPLGPDVSYAREGNGFVKTSEPTPGYPNTQAGRERFLSAWSMENSSLQLNEIMATNSRTLVDADGEYVDWIELYNRGSETIDLSQYALSDDPANPIQWRFPAGATIEPGGYFLVYASGKNLADPDAPHTNFRLRAEGETVLLCDLLGHVLDSTTYDNLKDDTVWARWGNNSPWTVLNNPTPKKSNP